MEKTLGQSLKRCRMHFKFTQEEIAKKLGILQQSYYKYESDKAVPSANVIIKLAIAYNVSADYLLGFTDAPNQLNLSECSDHKQSTDSDTGLIETLINTQKNLNLALKKLGVNPNDF